MKPGPKPPKAILLLLLALAAAGTRGASGQERLRCVSVASIDRTEVIDDRTIAFFLSGGRIYVNRLDRACPNLNRGRPFSYRTSTGQLCSVDVITVVEDFGQGLDRGASCGLGEFVPTDKETLEMLKGEREPVEVTPEEVEVEE
jgi:hypothetical protein